MTEFFVVVVFFLFFLQYPHLAPTNNNNNNDNQYISRALNPSVNNQPEAQSGVHVQLKPSKETSEVKKKKFKTTHTSKQTKKSRGWAGKGARSKYQVNN